MKRICCWLLAGSILLGTSGIHASESGALSKTAFMELMRDSLASRLGISDLILVGDSCLRFIAEDSIETTLNLVDAYEAYLLHPDKLSDLIGRTVAQYVLSNMDLTDLL